MGAFSGQFGRHEALDYLTLDRRRLGKCCGCVGFYVPPLEDHLTRRRGSQSRTRSAQTSDNFRSLVWRGDQMTCEPHWLQKAESETRLAPHFRQKRGATA